MPWNTPVTPTPGQVITTAWAQGTIIENLNWLRQLLGGADPPGSSYVPVSVSTTSVGWSKVPDAAMQYAPVHQLSQVPADFSSASSLLSGFLAVTGTTDGPLTSGNWHLIQSRWPDLGFDYRVQIASEITTAGSLYVRQVISGTPGTWNKLWHAGNDGAGSGLDADLLDGQSSAFYATASSVSSISTVPSGAIVAFATAAELTAAGAGWARYTAADGRGLIGAGTAGGQTFTENTAVNPTGGNWIDNTGAPSPTAASSSGAGFTSPTSAHTHTMDLRFPSRIVVWGRKT